MGGSSTSRWWGVMEMQGEQFLSQLLAAGAGPHAHFPSVSHLFSGAHRSPPAGSNDATGGAGGHHYDARMVGMCGGQVGADHAGSSCYRSMESSPAGFEMDNSAWDGGNGRWPRQETLTLLEIRSRLDAKFKEANHKGPLWDEVAG